MSIKFESRSKLNQYVNLMGIDIGENIMSNNFLLFYCVDHFNALIINFENLF